MTVTAKATLSLYYEEESPEHDHLFRKRSRESLEANSNPSPRYLTQEFKASPGESSPKKRKEIEVVTSAADSVFKVPRKVTFQEPEVAGSRANRQVVELIETHVTYPQKVLKDVIYKNGHKYHGELKNGKREGWGILSKSNGDFIYVGYYKNNLKDGKGELYLANRHKYVGPFLNDHFHGKGLIKAKKVAYNVKRIILFEGFFQKGVIQGKGCLRLTDGRYYKGHFEQGLMTEGVITVPVSRDCPNEIKCKVVVKEGNLVSKEVPEILEETFAELTKVLGTLL
jgi:hypothetical protein